MSLSIQQILTPGKRTDIFREISEAKAVQRPYIIALVGVNGVGKSTSLSKLVFWSMQKNFKVLIVAGDTFRSGAVEQLRVHANNLSSLGIGHVELFERGYGKDASAIAKDAIQYAKANRYDVVFIDTAGRMQDNLPLMRSLAKVMQGVYTVQGTQTGTCTVLCVHYATYVFLSSLCV